MSRDDSGRPGRRCRRFRAVDQRDPKPERQKGELKDRSGPWDDEDAFGPIALLPAHVAAALAVRQYDAAMIRMGILGGLSL